jgi:hypothetical protein
MSEVICPECGRATELVAVRRAAEEFCRHCDFPLFWAPSNIPVTTPGANSDTTLRRLPGAGGRNRVGSLICPACGELAPISATHCQRCSADLHPPTEPIVVVAAPLPTPPLVIVIEPEPETTPWWWWALLVGGVVAATVIIAIVIAN